MLVTPRLSSCCAPVLQSMLSIQADLSVTNPTTWKMMVVQFASSRSVEFCDCNREKVAKLFIVTLTVELLHVRINWWAVTQA